MPPSLPLRAAASNWLLNNSATCSGTSGFSQVAINFAFATAVPLFLGSLSDGVTIQAAACFPNQS